MIAEIKVHSTYEMSDDIMSYAISCLPVEGGDSTRVVFQTRGHLTEKLIATSLRELADKLDKRAAALNAQG